MDANAELAMDDDDESTRGTPAPQHRVYDPNDVADAGEIRRGEKLRADNVDAWETRCAGLVELLRGGPKTKSHIATWAHRAKVDGERMGMKLAEECLYWLEARGRVEPFKNFRGEKSYRLTGGVETSALPACLCARTAPDVNYGCPEHGGTRPTITTEEEIAPMMDNDTLNTAEAAALLGIKQSGVVNAVNKGRLKAKRGGRGVPLQLKRVDVIAYRAARAAWTQKLTTPVVGGAGGGGGGGGPVIVKLRGPAPAAAMQPAVLDDLRALVRCVDLGWMSSEDAWAKLRALVAVGL